MSSPRASRKIADEKKYGGTPSTPSAAHRSSSDIPAGTDADQQQSSSGSLSNLISSTSAWSALKEHAEVIKRTTLAELLSSDLRNTALAASLGDLFLDFSHQRVNLDTLDLLFDLAEQANVQGQIRAMFNAERINNTENRAVLHTALRAQPPPEHERAVEAEASKNKNFKSTKNPFLLDVHDARGNIVTMDTTVGVFDVLAGIKEFSERVRNEHDKKHKMPQGHRLMNTLVVGIGGSYLGTEFVYEALRTYKKAEEAARGRKLRFLANVDPVAVRRALSGLDPRETLVVVISKTFTTAETMLNAKTVRDWLIQGLGKDYLKKYTHMVAVSSNPQRCQAFGIPPQYVFDLWDFIGGRFSVSSAVGMLPIALTFGYDIVEEFLAGARSIDENFINASPRENLPLIMGLLGVWNSSFLGYAAHAIIPYSEALARFPAHVQQVDMESNGKRVTRDGSPLDFESGEIVFGEPGTNAQHSFFQMLHQGRAVPIDFIGFSRSQYPIRLHSENVPNHDELMSNFFAQPDALAYGRSESTLRGDKNKKQDEHLLQHKVFEGNRPSMSLLFPCLDPYSVGQLNALYEHRVAVQGFIWGLNSFDQWGVELGKELGKSVRTHIQAAREDINSIAEITNLCSATKNLLKRYVEQSPKT